MIGFLERKLLNSTYRNLKRRYWKVLGRRNSNQCRHSGRFTWFRRIRHLPIKLYGIILSTQNTNTLNISTLTVYANHRTGDKVEERLGLRFFGFRLTWLSWDQPWWGKFEFQKYNADRSIFLIYRIFRIEACVFFHRLRHTHTHTHTLRQETWRFESDSCLWYLWWLRWYSFSLLLFFILTILICLCSE